MYIYTNCMYYLNDHFFTNLIWNTRLKSLGYISRKTRFLN